MNNPGIARTTTRAIPQISGRFPTNVQGFDTTPEAGMLTRPTGDKAWDVQLFTGYPVARNPKSRFYRGQIVRMNAPTQIVPNKRFLTMYDPTDPRTWQNVT
jgi:hypothetical protein